MEWDELSELIRALRKRPLVTGNACPVQHDQAAIQRALPHRSPMLLVDDITHVDLEARTVAGTRRIDPEDPVLAGHFPGQPVYPGVLQVEMMGQMALCLAHFVVRATTELGSDAKPVNVRALKIHYAQYLEPILPGDVVTIQASIVEEDGMTATSAGQLIKEGRIASFSVQEVYFVD